MRKLPIKIGDIFEIPLSDGQRAFGQYVYRDEKWGLIIQVFNFFAKEKGPIDIQEFTNKELLFPPVFTGLHAAIRSKKWKIIGNLQINKFKYPGFISTLTNSKTGEASTWYLWDGENSIVLGKQVPEEFKGLEYLAIYPADFIVDRIMTGKKPNEQLIMTNREPIAPPLTKEKKEELNKIIHGGN